MAKLHPGVTYRSILIGLILIPLNVYWLTTIEVKWYSLDGSCLVPFIEPVFILFIVVLLNRLLKRTLPGRELKQGELLVIYIMLVVSVSLAGHDMMQNMFGSILHPFRYASPENEWKELFFRYIPNWVTVRDKNAIEGFYAGGSTFYKPGYMKAWLVPLAVWGSFLFVLIFVMLCINVIIRRRWTEEERLVFPTIRLPLAMSEDSVSKWLFKNRLMWAGFVVAATMELVVSK